jgi:hypothetical protein
MSEVTRLYDLPQIPMIQTVVSEVTRLYDLPQVPMIKTVGVTSDTTVLIIGTWGRSYKRVTSDTTVLIIGTPSTDDDNGYV